MRARIIHVGWDWAAKKKLQNHEMCIAEWGQVLFRMRAEGPAVLPAQGNALGIGGIQYRSSAQRANRSTERLARWADEMRWLVFPAVPRALPWAGRTEAPSGQRGLAPREQEPTNKRC